MKQVYVNNTLMPATAKSFAMIPGGVRWHVATKQEETI
jgi:hypothetical protein